MSAVNEFVPFKREDHIYHNEAFAELCKDAVRAFNGTPVCELPPPRFAGSGVYAIYCTAKKGIYERYGNKVNRMGYNVPIYVGKAVPKGCTNDSSCELNTLPIHGQLDFWYDRIKRSMGFITDDFRCRVYRMRNGDTWDVDGVYRMMIEVFNPVWNRVFASCRCTNDILFRWRQIHSERFHSKADTDSREELIRLLEVA